MNLNTAIKHLKGARREGIAAIFVRGDLTNPVMLDKLGNIEPRKITKEDLRKEWVFMRFIPELTPEYENYDCVRIERYESDNLANPYITYQLTEGGLPC